MFLLTCKELYDRTYIVVGERLYHTQREAQRAKLKWMGNGSRIAEWRFIELGRV